jgi:hypothetical protein
MVEPQHRFRFATAELGGRASLVQGGRQVLQQAKPVRRAELVRGGIFWCGNTPALP